MPPLSVRAVTPLTRVVAVGATLRVELLMVRTLEVPAKAFSKVDDRVGVLRDADAVRAGR